MWARLRAWWHQFLTLSGQRATPRQPQLGPRYRIIQFEVRTDAQAAAHTPRVVAVFRSGSKPKWAYLTCPCGCDQLIALNLMASQHPSWRVSVRTETDFSIFPSVDSTTCGAHFWLRAGRVTWAV